MGYTTDVVEHAFGPVAAIAVVLVAGILLRRWLGAGWRPDLPFAGRRARQQLEDEFRREPRATDRPDEEGT